MRTMTRAVAIVSLSLFLAATLAAQNVNVTGTWAFDVQTGGGGGQPTANFKQDGEKLTGHYSSQTLGEADFTGTVKGNAIQFSFNADVQGNAVDVAYAGTVDGNTMKGTTGNGQSWTATRK